MSAPLEHEWETVSRHRTSDGVVTYRRCRCGTWRIGLDRAPASGFPVGEESGGEVSVILAEPF